MRIRIVQTPGVTGLDGVDLRHFQVGTEYDVGRALASVMLTEGWAEPVPIDAPPAPIPFGPDDPFTTPLIDRNTPPKLVKEQHPRIVERHLARETRRHRRRRKR
jgi:hypothetical protein